MSPTLAPNKKRCPPEVKKALKPRGMKGALARRANVSLSHVSKWARGKADSSRLTVLAEELIRERGAA